MKRQIRSWIGRQRMIKRERNIKKLIETIFEWMKVSKKGLIEKQFLRAMIVKSLKRNIIQRKYNKYEVNNIATGLIHLQTNGDISKMNKEIY